MFAVFLLIVLQLIGEVFVRISGLPVPGAVIGLVLLYSILVYRGEIPEELARTSGFLLQNLGLLFVPTGVGVIAFLPMITDQWWIILPVLLISVVVTIAVTGWTVTRLSPPVVAVAETGAGS
jgi:holin-like protein